MLVERLSRVADLGAEWVLWLLLILSVVSVAVMFERALYYWRRRKALQAVACAFSEFQASHDPAVVEAAARQGEEVEQRCLRKMLRIWREKGKVPDGFMVSMSAEYTQEQERLLAILGTLGNTAPFVGLFGTVIGIIKAFASLSSNLEGGANLVMGDISEALVATAVGLFVAIPAVVAYNFFMRRLDRNLARFQALAQGIFAIMPDRNGKE
jgi:biopolymer transport protein ExbB